MSVPKATVTSSEKNQDFPAATHADLGGVGGAGARPDTTPPVQFFAASSGCVVDFIQQHGSPILQGDAFSLSHEVQVQHEQLAVSQQRCRHSSADLVFDGPPTLTAPSRLQCIPGLGVLALQVANGVASGAFHCCAEPARARAKSIAVTPTAPSLSPPTKGFRMSP